MNLSAEKRKMPRMRVDFSATIFWGIANNRSDVNIQDLSIHGICFRSKKYFTQGTQFHLILPNEREESEGKKIQAEVVRHETLNGFSSGGKFKIGAKFLFKAHRSADSKENPSTETLFPLQPINSQNPLQIIHEGKSKNYPVQTNTRGTPGPSACRIRIRKVHAEHVQWVRTSAKEETVYTSIQIKKARFIASPSSSSSMLTSSEEFQAEIGNSILFANLVRQNFSDKRLP